jgi:site-specific recombinase XerD
MRAVREDKLFPLIRDYLMDYLPNKRFYSPNTIEAYRTALSLFLDFVCASNSIELHQVTFDLITSDMLSRFLDWLEHERHCSPTTRNHRLACIRSFYKYAGMMDITLAVFRQNIMKVPLKKTETSKTVKFLDEDALRILLQQPDLVKPKEFRNLFYMVLMYDTGCRNQEILDLKLHNLRVTEKNPYVIVTGKGNKTRTVPIMAKTVKYFEKYAQMFHNDMVSDRYLFYVKTKGLFQQMSPDNVARFMQKYGENASDAGAIIPGKLHPHMLRSTRAMHLYRGGMPLALLSEWLGHANLETTMIYAYADTEMKRRAILKATAPENHLKSAVLDFMPQTTDKQTMKTLYGLR